MYVCKGQELWELPVQIDSSWTWKKMMKLRPLVETMVTRQNGEVLWVFKNGKYSSTEVWNFAREKRVEVAWRNLIWGTGVVPKHSIHLLAGFSE